MGRDWIGLAFESLNIQIDQARSSLADAERELQEFKDETQITDLEQSDGGVLGKVSEIQRNLEEVQTQRQLAQANLSTYKMRVSQIEPVPIIISYS